MTIIELLEAHEPRLLNYACSCGAEFPPPNEQGRPYLKYRAHVAEVLDAHMQVREAGAWRTGVDTALNHAILNPDGITLRLEHLDGRPWANPYKEESSNGR